MREKTGQLSTWAMQIIVAVVILYISFTGGAIAERTFTTSAFDARLGSLEIAAARTEVQYEEIIRRLDSLATRRE